MVFVTDLESRIKRKRHHYPKLSSAFFVAPQDCRAIPTTHFDHVGQCSKPCCPTRCTFSSSSRYVSPRVRKGARKEASSLILFRYQPGDVELWYCLYACGATRTVPQTRRTEDDGMPIGGCCRKSNVALLFHEKR